MTTTSKVRPGSKHKHTSLDTIRTATLTSSTSTTIPRSYIQEQSGEKKIIPASNIPRRTTEESNNPRKKVMSTNLMVLKRTNISRPERSEETFQRQSIRRTSILSRRTVPTKAVVAQAAVMKLRERMPSTSREPREVTQMMKMTSSPSQVARGPNLFHQQPVVEEESQSHQQTQLQNLQLSQQNLDQSHQVRETSAKSTGSTLRETCTSFHHLEMADTLTLLTKRMW